ncbi:MULTISPECIES: cupin domain-containing protein [unclassified Halorubrum]|uniref:cupin domain-containing protein n=1 Tax=unclassified Halorubrum TaxID=2642239 RepID=UPI000B989D90|nr:MULTISPECIES: cupin domain-containing protein [unclassified Halorubrum]OYR42279.1 cupin [Halorubrum sp. Eb13]OYR45178.1 cupin [Halorubrum sp. Hd13]OYR53023.1 cupin [Halorubrum sp. Ea8]OYR54422.1 cupin [Halorubrum sp. Ea1]
MGYDTTAYDDVEPRAPGMYFLRDALDCESLGVTVVEADDGWEGMEHDHADAGHEEVYVLLHGAATLTVDGEAVELGPGDAVRVDADSTRDLAFSADGSRMVIAGAP